MFALGTPKRKAVALCGGLLVLALLWTLWRGSPLGAVVILPLFYPFLLGHLPWPIVVALAGIFGLVGWLAWRSRSRHKKAAFGVLGYCALAVCLLFWGRVCETAKIDWVAWHMGGAGLSAGLDRAEVQAALETRATVDECTPGGCSYRPKGLASFAFAIFDAYGVNTEYGPNGRLERWQTWSD